MTRKLLLLCLYTSVQPPISLLLPHLLQCNSPASLEAICSQFVVVVNVPVVTNVSYPLTERDRCKSGMASMAVTRPPCR